MRDEYLDADIEKIMEEVSRCLIDDEYGDTFNDNEIYKRSITIDLPVESSFFPGVQSITISIRDLLTWYIELGPTCDRERVSHIRDNFFGGDEPDDYETGLMITDGLHTPEERASVRWELDQGEAERTKKRAELDENLQKYEADEERRWLPFIAKRAELDAECDAQYARAVALDEEWYSFVCKGKTDKSLTKRWIDERRATLQAKTDQLIADQQKTDEAYAELRAQTFDKI